MLEKDVLGLIQKVDKQARWSWLDRIFYTRVNKLIEEKIKKLINAKVGYYIGQYIGRVIVPTLIESVIFIGFLMLFGNFLINMILGLPLANWASFQNITGLRMWILYFTNIVIWHLLHAPNYKESFKKFQGLKWSLTVRRELLIITFIPPIILIALYFTPVSNFIHSGTLLLVIMGVHTIVNSILIEAFTTSEKPKRYNNLNLISDFIVEGHIDPIEILGKIQSLKKYLPLNYYFKKHFVGSEKATQTMCIRHIDFESKCRGGLNFKLERIYSALNAQSIKGSYLITESLIKYYKYMKECIEKGMLYDEYREAFLELKLLMPC